MRVLAAFSGGFALAVFAACFLLPFSWLPWLGALAMLCGVLLLRSRERFLWGLVSALFGLALGFGCFYGRALMTRERAASYDGQELRLWAELRDYPQVYDDYARLEVTLTLPDGTRLGAYVYDRSETAPDLKPGDRMEATLRLSRADLRYGERYREYNARGVYLMGSLRELHELVSCERLPLRAWPLRINRLLVERVGSLFDEGTAGFFQALMLGERRELYEDETLYVALSRAGLMHIVAVSGMHVAFVVSLLQALLGVNRRSSLLCLMLVWGFVLLTGAAPSALRAGVMQSFLLLAPLLKRENDPITSLSAALLFILLLNPFAAASLSLQLSFLAILGLMAFSEPLTALLLRPVRSKRRRRRLRGPVSGAANSLSVLALSAPLTAGQFGYLSLLSPLSNLLCLWTVPLCFGGGYLACLLSLLHPALGGSAAWLVSWPARWLFFVARTLSRLRFAVVPMRHWLFWLWLGLGYLLFGWAYFSRRKLRLRILLPVTATLLSLVLLLGGFRLYYRSGAGTVTVLSVGQGQCITVFQGDKTLMIDCGGLNTLQNAGDKAASYLLQCGRDRVDALLLTHLDSDHLNGVTRLMAQLPVDHLLLRSDPVDEGGFLPELTAAAARGGTELSYIAGESELLLGELSVRLFTPSEGGSDNDHGLVALLSLGGCEVLVTGDLSAARERELLSEQSIGGVELFVVGHHGSRYSNCEELLRSIGAETAVISVGYNSYGHPAEETLDRLEKNGYTVYRTDRDGDVEFRVGGSDG